MHSQRSTPVRASDFRTPAHILIPKLVKGRDAWKAKANSRQQRLHAQRIHIRDLSASRLRWKNQARTAAVQLALAQEQLQLAHAQLAQLQHPAPQN